MKINTKILFFIAFLAIGVNRGNAQDTEDPYGDAYDPNSYDSAAATEDPYNYSNTYDEAEPETPQKKPYVRFVVPFDTITEMVSYERVVEEEEAGADSLYWRAKRWLNYEFSKTDMKKSIKKDDKKEYKIIMEGEFPLYIEANKYSKVPNGKIQFDMELRFKEGRYKYKLNNFVHLIPPPPGEKNDIRTYFEFYRKSTINPKGNDMILISADKKVNKMIEALVKYCKEPIYIDDDDW